ncbi:MAG: glycoside hydrolase family 9 protein [Candidatus Kryptoniota bacterium]
MPRTISKLKKNPIIVGKAAGWRRNLFAGVIAMFFLPLSFNTAFSQKLQLNDFGYFETRGLNVFVFSNQYNGYFFDEKTAGIELIHHGVRTATGGAVRLRSTPEQWDAVPDVVKRNVDKKNNSIEVLLRYKDYNFDSRVVVRAADQGVMIDVYLDKPLPEKLIGNAGFNLEFLPPIYFEKTYLMDGNPGILPKYPEGPMVVKPDSLKIPQHAGHSTFDGRGRGVYVDPLPMAEGSTIVLAPEDPEQRVEIQSLEGTLMLYDGRNVAQNGWFVVRSLIPANKTGKVVEWHLTASTIKNWIREPVIEFSQVGYVPAQEKRAVIELDKNDTPLKTASLYQVTPQGNYVDKLTAKVKSWGQFTRYNYVTFNFSSVKDPGLYFIKYGNQSTDAFPIDSHVYDSVWHQTLDVWFPVQMDHMYVKDAYRVWHGVPFLDDARQAPVNEEHFDGYRMGPTTDTKYKPGEHIPGLNVGGWFDAGDFDIDEASQCQTILNLSATWEAFHPKIDETYIDEQQHYVDIHDPDGKPDILQQIEHGVLQQLAQQKAFGRAIAGITEAHLYQYVHLGDASTITDNLIYNPRLAPYQVKGDSSGTPDERWAFTNNEPWTNYLAIASLAAASRALRGFNDSLADECLSVAGQSWTRQQADTTAPTGFGDFALFRQFTEAPADLQLFIATKDKRYAERFEKAIWSSLDRSLDYGIQSAIPAVPYLGSEYKAKLEPYVEKFKKEDDGLFKANPYGVPIGTRHWAGDEEVVGWAVTNYYLHEAFPNIIGPEYAIRGIDYLFGCHPYSNVSFVASVGVHSKKVIYGRTRADLTFVAGGVVPGILVLQPDFPENQDNWPFLWDENECVINICADYIFLGNAVNDLLNQSSMR